MSFNGIEGEDLKTLNAIKGRKCKEIENNWELNQYSNVVPYNQLKVVSEEGQ